MNLYVYEFSVIADQVFDQIYNIFVFYTFCGLLLQRPLLKWNPTMFDVLLPQ